MPTYVAFLRAINLGARRRFPNDAIRAAAELTGARDTLTHLGTGNLRLTTGLRSTARVTAVLDAAFLADRGFEVPTVVLTPAELVDVAATAAELGATHTGRHYVELLRDPPDPDVVADLQADPVPGSRAVVEGRAVHLLVDPGLAGATVLRARAVRRLGTTTNRAATVVRELARRWG